MLFDLTFFNNYGLIGLLLVTFFAFTILPLPYEPAIVASLSSFNPFYVFIFALVGSVLGSMLNYYIGHHGVKRLLPSENSRWYKKANKLIENHGDWSILFFNWIPLIGDPLIILAGSFGMKFWKFLVFCLIGRAVYFSMIIWLGISIHGWV